MFDYIKIVVVSFIMAVVCALVFFYVALIGFLDHSLEETNAIAERELFFAKQFVLGKEERFENHLINKKLNKTEIQGERIAEPVVCVLDTSDNGHYEKVNSFLSQYYTGETRFFENNDYYFNLLEGKNRELLACDIINYASGIVFETEDETSLEETYIEDFFSHYEGIVVVAAGNIASKNTTLQQEFVRVRKTNPEYADQIVVVGQVAEENRMAYGEEIDVTVPNADYVYNEQLMLSGTSFSSPVVTAVIANLMAVYPGMGADWYKERVTQNNKTFEQTVEGVDYAYPLLNIGNAYNQQ